MTVRVGINGFGRIGRMVLRAALEAKHPDVKIVAINSGGDISALVHLLKYDSVHGTLNTPIETGEDWFDAGQGRIRVSSNYDPATLDWEAAGVDLVMECSGKFNSREKSAVHLQRGAKYVLVSAPCTGADITVVYGVNHDQIHADHRVISNASCTTNCLAPIVHVLHRDIGIKNGMMTTVHAYTGDQNTIDTRHKDLRRARAAGLSMIPTSTGAAKAIGLVLPALDGKLEGMSIRVPTANVSLVDLVFNAMRKTSMDEINALVTKAAGGAMAGVLAVNDVPLVSCDFNHNPASAVFDLTQTRVSDDGDLCHVLAWYDNEWGFSCRMLDVAAIIAPWV